MLQKAVGKPMSKFGLVPSTAGNLWCGTLTRGSCCLKLQATANKHDCAQLFTGHGVHSLMQPDRPKYFCLHHRQIVPGAAHRLLPCDMWKQKGPGNVLPGGADRQRRMARTLEIHRTLTVCKVASGGPAGAQRCVDDGGHLVLMCKRAWHGTQDSLDLDSA